MENLCPQCGAPAANGAAHCQYCGAALPAQQPQPQPQYQQPQYQQPQYQQTQYQQGQPQAAQVSFGDAIKLFFANYTNFAGRSRRSEYWWAYLFNMLASSVLSVIPVIGWIASIALLIPGLSLSVRRLHDVGKSGWYLLFSLIPLFGAIYLLVLFCSDSGPDNQWGPNPKR